MCHIVHFLSMLACSSFVTGSQVKTRDRLTSTLLEMVCRMYNFCGWKQFSENTFNFFPFPGRRACTVVVVFERQVW